MTKHETLLSIDIDWVMSPRDSKDLLEVLIPIFKKTKFKKIVIGQSHREISKIVDTLVSPVYCVNVDHHHDIQYIPSEPLEAGFLSGNWLGHYMKSGRIKGCTWIANYDSAFNRYQDWRKDFVLLNNDILDTRLDINAVSDFEYDYFFMCRSFHNHFEGNWTALQTFDSIEVILKNLQNDKSKR